MALRGGPRRARQPLPGPGPPSRGHGPPARRAGRGAPAGGEPAAYASGSGATTEAERVHDALAALDATDREIVTLTYWDGLTADQVGRVVGLRGAAVRKRLQQARERMASTLTLPGRSETEGTLREGSQARGESVPAH